MPSLTDVVPEVLSRESRARRFGVDCASELRWHAKEPGGDYKQKLLLKNMSNQVIKFKYKLPKTNFFFMNFPDVVTLSPGMAAAVDVSFRPIKSELYDDVIEFITSNGNFFIRVIATLPEHGVKMQEYLDFGFATCREESVRTFVLRNVGEVDAPFELLADPPFSVSPRTGTIIPGKTMSIKLMFFPTEASVFVGTVVCKQPAGPALVMKISGIGKIPFLQVSRHQIDFENVLTGQHKTEELILTNASLVPVSFQLQPLPHDRDPTFHWNITSGKIPADGSLALNVRYIPLATGSFDCEYFDIITPGGNKQQICCMGYGEPHNVTLGVNSINFGNLELGKVSLRTVEIINHTRAQAFYQFVTEPAGCFEFSRTDGTIIPESSINVDIRFKARIPGNFYRRIFVLVKNQGPLYLDLTATGYHQNQDQVPRPMPLYQKHVENYWRRQIQEGTDHAMAIHDTENAGDPVAWVWNEFFLDDTDQRRQVRLQDSEVEFGAAASVGVNEYKTITVVNNTDVKQTALFVVPPDNYVEQPEGAGDIKMTTLGPVLQPLETCFKIFPDKGDVLPHSSTSFKVAFRPVYGNAYYAQAVEVFVFPKTQRNFRLVNDDNFVPPHCVQPVCSGNTFPPGMEAFTPKLRVPTTRINFPACSVNDKAYQVVEMYNDADTPMRFQLEKDPAEIFRCKPSNGLIMPHCAQLVAFMFCPSEAKRYQTEITCTMNGSARHAVQFTLVGKGNACAVQLDTSHLQIKPTCVGSVSTRALEIHNPAGVPVHYEWQIPDGYRKTLLVEPARGVLRGNERHTLFWHFAPKKDGPYSVKVPLRIERAQVKTLGDVEVADMSDLADTMQSSASNPNKRRTQMTHLHVYGVGAGGAVTFEPEVVDFGTLVVGSEVTRVIKLINHSDCTMYHDLQSNMPNLTYKEGTGILSAFSTKRVTICFTPESRMYYNVTISCKLRTGSEALDTNNFGDDHTGLDLLMQQELEDMPQCQVLGNAVYPILSVMDVRSEGMSSSRLWREFSFIQMNHELSSDLSSTEILWNKAEIDETDPSKVLKVMEMRFKVKEMGSAPSVTIMRVKNTGVLPLDYLLKYPRDDEDEPENWVDKDLQGAEELTLNMILENKLFVCEPRRGHLEIGEEVDLVFSYKHTIPTGEFRLPVILNVCELPPAGGIVNTGKQVVLCLIGQTLQPMEPYLHIPVADTRYFKYCEWGFERTPIGLLTPPLQYYKLENLGGVPLAYHLDLTEVENLNNNSFRFDVVTCLDNTDGQLEPGESVTLRWVFNPLEAKQYIWNVPISVVGGDTRIVKFHAEGYHPDPHVTPETTVWQLPIAQLMPLPNQPVLMSAERICFGDIPMGATIHRMVTLTNYDKEEYMVFSFDLNGEQASSLLSIQPSEGEIMPDSHVVVRITMRCMTTSVFDFDVPCVTMLKPPPEEENEDLADDGDKPAGATATSTSPGTRPQTGATALTTGGGQTGKSQSRRRKRISVIDQPPPPRGGQKGGPARGSVSFMESANVQTLDNSTMKKPDDMQSVKSGSSKLSGGTALTSQTQGSTATGAPGRVPEKEDSPDFDYTLSLSIQGHVRVPEMHRKLFENEGMFWYPKGSMLPNEASPFLERSTITSPGRRPPSTGSRPSTATEAKAGLKKMVTEGVLEQLLNDILNDDEVMATFDELDELPAPCYVQMIKEPPVHFRMPISTLGQSEASEGAAAAQTEAGTVTVPATMAKVRAGIDVPGHSAQILPDEEDSEEREKQLKRKTVMNLPEFENLAQFIVDACIFNLLEEATFGEDSVT